MISLTVHCSSCASRASVEFDELAPGEALWVCPTCRHENPMGVCGKLLSIKRVDVSGPTEPRPSKLARR
jgi:hypothetical protein